MLAILLGVALLTTLEQSGTAPATGSIAGQVREAGSHSPIADARVSISGPGVHEATTADSAGQFRFASLAPGRYRIDVDKETYAFDFVGAPSIAVNARTTTSVTVEMQRAGVIVGEVRDDRGSPRGGVPVTAIRKIAGGTQSVPRPQQTTNDLGEFRVDGLVAGEYIVLASPPTPRVNSAALMPTYYPATTDRNAASTVDVSSGGTANVAITMVSAPAYEITGVVVDEQGLPLAGVAVSFVFQSIQTGAPREGGLQVRAERLLTRADGTFRIAGLGPGTYRLTPTPAGPPGTRNELELVTTAVNGNSSTVGVDVRDADVAGVRIVMRTQR